MNWKPFEPHLHRAMGFGAELVNLGLLLDRRERKQLPPENDAYPVKYLVLDQHGNVLAATMTRETAEAVQDRITRQPTRLVEYWAKPRVMDTLDDTRDYAIGATIGWFVVVGVSLWLGSLI